MSTPAPNRKRLKKVGGSLLGLVVVVLGVLWFMGVIGGNVREVDPGRYYRSAQLSEGTLDGVVRKYGIKTILNLRGPEPGDAAYESELAICKSQGLTHDDISLSATHLPPPKEIQKAVEDLDKLPKPVLVHCKGGADRAGLVSTLYMNIYEGVPLDQAEDRELTWRYGHLAFTSSHPMNDFFDLYRQDSHGQDLKTWIFKTYPEVYKAKQATGGREIGAATKDE